MDYRLDFSALEWISPSPGARYKQIQQANASYRILEMTEEFVEPDWCTRAHTGYVIEGEMELDINGTITRYSAGDGLFLPAGQSHRHRHVSTKGRVRLFLVEQTQ